MTRQETAVPAWALRDAADELLDLVYRADRDDLIRRFGPRDVLVEHMVTQALSVIRKLEAARASVRPDESVRLAAAMLSWRGPTGVHRAANNARAKFESYRSYPELLPEILVRIERFDLLDDRPLVALLARSTRALRLLSDAAFTRDIDLVLTLAVPAVAELRTGHRPAGPDSDSALVDATRSLLEEGRRRTARYRVERRPVPSLTPEQPVLGNPDDLLVTLGAIVVGLDELRGQAAVEPLDAMEAVLPAVVDVLRLALRPDRRGWFGPGTSDEPDFADAWFELAMFLGAEPGDRSSPRKRSAKGGPGRRVRAVARVLHHRLPLPGGADDVGGIPVGEFGPPDRTGRAPDEVAHVEHLVGWLIAALFDGAEPQAREPLVAWLSGHRPADRSASLGDLLCRLTAGACALDRIPIDPPPRPAGVSPGDLVAMVEHLAGAPDLGEIEGYGLADARRLILAAVPPLWTERRPIIGLLTAHLREELGRKHSGPRKAAVVGIAGARAPIQYLLPRDEALTSPCCPSADLLFGRRPDRPARPPAEPTDVCRHRPWGEPGWVETYATVGGAVPIQLNGPMTGEAVRQQLNRYKGPWSELLRCLSGKPRG